MGDQDYSQVTCNICNSNGVYEDEGQFFCNNCYSQVEDIIVTGVADEDFVPTDTRGGGATYTHQHTRHVTSQPVILSAANPPTDPLMGPREPADFGNVPKGVEFSQQDYYQSVRMRYVMGVQLLVQYQCEALVDKFGANPLICGISGEVWLRFVASTKVFDDDWATKTIEESEKGEKKEHKGTNAKFKNEPRNYFKERMAMIWCKALKRTIPLYCSLAVSYLACYIAREPLLPTDVLKWAVEGKLPYFGAFPKIEESIKEIEREYECPAFICPIKANYMFRPLHAVPVQKLESMAASIAQAVGLDLPPVNFYAIACRYLKQLSLPVGKIVPYACRIQKWATPPELWLSADELRLPTRVCVMSVLIVAIRMLYNINGFGKWETSLSTNENQVASSVEFNTKDDAADMPTSPTLDEESEESSFSAHKFETDCADLLKNLEKRYNCPMDKYEYSKDLPTYLQYCKDVVFAGVEPLYNDSGLIEELWEFYEKNREGVEASAEFEAGLNQKRGRDDSISNTAVENKKHRDDETNSLSAGSGDTVLQEGGPGCSHSNNTPQNSQPNQTSPAAETAESSDISKDIAIQHLKIDMEEHRFSYIPPRTKVKRHDYLHYRRKVDGDGSYTYVAHADYYILLRACAKVAEVDVRVMHYSVLSLEKRLGWIEKRIDQCVEHMTKPSTHSTESTSEQTS